MTLSFFLEEPGYWNDKPGQVKINATRRDIALVRSAFRRHQVPVREIKKGRGYGNDFIMQRSDIPKEWIDEVRGNDVLCVPCHDPKPRGVLRTASGSCEGVGCELERKERNDCTVHALAAACGLTYLQAHKICEDSGRHQGKGHVSFRIMEEIRLRHGARVEKINFRVSKGINLGVSQSLPPMTLKTFIASHTQGSYFITIRHHAIGLVDGKVISSQPSEPLYAKMHKAWRIRAKQS